MNMKFYKHLLTAIMICLFCGSVANAQSTPAIAVNTPADLDAGRVKIDSLDNQLMKILGERERIAQAIGVYKAKNHMPPLQEARFKQVVAKSIEVGKKEGLSAEFITELMNAIHKESLRIEGEVATTKQ
jgi:chorismate mutase